MNRAVEMLNRLKRSARYRGAHWLTAARRAYSHALAAALPRRVSLPPPLIIVGSPAAGKTTLAGLLALHPQVLDLRHSDQVWRRAYPAAHLDTGRPGPLHARLALTAADCAPERTERLRRLLWAELRAAGRTCLVDEKPWHSYRIEFLRGVFPDARFVHIIRHGLDAAGEMEARCRTGRLWGGRPRLWAIIEAHAQAAEPYRGLLGLCRTDFERGLLLWRMTVETARAAAQRHLPVEHYLEVRYERLRREPRAVCREAAAHIGLEGAAWEAAEAQFNPGPPPERPPAPATAGALAGELLAELGYA